MNPENGLVNIRFKYLPHIAFVAAVIWTVVAVRREDDLAETIVAILAWAAFAGLVVGRWLLRMRDTRQQ